MEESILHPILKDNIYNAFDDLLQEQVSPWVFLETGTTFSVKRFDGRKISYRGIKYLGSPQAVFWGEYIEPFLKKICTQEIENAINLAEKKNIPLPEVLRDVKNLLHTRITHTYKKMQDIDRNLSGDIKCYKPHQINAKISSLKSFASERIEIELKLWKQKPINVRFGENKFWVWIIGIVITIISILVTVFL